MIKKNNSSTRVKKAGQKSSSKAICIDFGSSDFEKKFQIEEDARTLARYQEIMGDSKRKNAAVAEAKKQAAEFQKKADMLKKATK